MSFGKPRAIRIIHAESRRSHTTTVNQGGRTGNANESAPGARPNQGSQAGFPEIIGKRIPSGSGPAVDEHGFGTEMRHRRPGPVFSVAHIPEGQCRPVE